MNWITHFMIFLLSLIIIFIGSYLWLHRKKNFLIFSPQNIPSLSTFLTIFGITLISMGVITLIISLVSNLTTFLITMIIDVFLIMILTFFLLSYLL